MNKVTLKAEKRELSGRKVKQLRKSGIIPANVFGKKVKSQAIQLDSKEFKLVYEKTGETGLIELTIGSEKKPVLIHNIQNHPVEDHILHVDFLQVDLTQKVSAMVPIELVGESPAEKQGLGTVVQYVNELEVEALPENLPDKFEIDLSKLTDIEQMVLVKDIKVDKSKVEIKKSDDEILIKVEPQKEEKEEPVPAPEAETPEGEAKESGEEQAPTELGEDKEQSKSEGK